MLQTADFAQHRKIPKSTRMLITVIQISPSKAKPADHVWVYVSYIWDWNLSNEVDENKLGNNKNIT